MRYLSVFEILNQLPKYHRIGVISLICLIVSLLFWNSAEPLVTLEIELPELTSDISATQSKTPKTTRYEIQMGDSLSAIFDKAHISPQTLHSLIKDRARNRLLRAIQPGEFIEFEQNIDGVLLALNYVKSPQLTENFTLIEENVIHKSVVRYPEYRTRFAFGKIESSLFLAGQAAGMSDASTMELAQIFGWDIDFALDIRQGDSFSMIYQEKHLDGKMIGYGPILAARFTNNGKTFNAVRYTDKEGNSDFYSPDGNSMRKAFLRTPVDYARISSHFSLGRRHPILNTIRNHKGTDYAAPKNTAIRAAGDGKVITAGRKGGFGTTLIIQHGQRYSTLYAHLNAFHKSVRIGKQVKQGQIVGYVGSTGLATGPHLHYEFRVNGVAVNPVTVKLPSAKPISSLYKAEFLEHAENMTGQLDVYEKAGFSPAE